MKNYILLFALTFISATLSAQKVKESEVPKSVKESLTKSYPDAKSVKWDKEKDGWEASFTQSKTEMSVVIDANGNIAEVESEIEGSQLPTIVKDSFVKEFSGYKIKEAAKIIAGPETTYEIEAAKGKDKFEFIYDANGKLLTMKELKKDKEEKD